MFRFNILKQQERDIEEVINTIYENINQQRSDLEVCLPELKEALCSLLQEHCNDIKDLADQLGVDHSMVLLWGERVDQLGDAANEAMYLAGIMLRNDTEDLDCDVAEKWQADANAETKQHLSEEALEHQSAEYQAEYQAASGIIPPTKQMQVSTGEATIWQQTSAELDAHQVLPEVARKHQAGEAGEHQSAEYPAEYQAASCLLQSKYKSVWEM